MNGDSYFEGLWSLISPEKGLTVFTFRVAEIGNPHPRPVVPEHVRTEQDFGRLRELWEHM